MPRRRKVSRGIFFGGHPPSPPCFVGLDAGVTYRSTGRRLPVAGWLDDSVPPATPLTPYPTHGGLMATATAPHAIDPSGRRDVGGKSARPKVQVRQTKMLVDGKWIDSTSGRTFETINPATGEVIARVAEGEAPDVDKA